METDGEFDETTQITRKGQVTVPKRLREEYGLEEGDRLRWVADEDGIRVRTASRAAGRGLLVDEGVSEESREEMAEELVAEIRAKRTGEWQPE